MKTSILHSLVLAAATLLAANTNAAGLSEKFRAVSCDLDTRALHTGEILPNLKNLLDNADPDIVLLQGAINWETCERVAQLRPGLRVVTCSAFSAEPKTALAPQVGILARDKALISWVEEISAKNGFAFAMLQAGPRKLAIFSVQTADPAANDRVLTEIKKLQKFANNRPDSFLIAGAPLQKNVFTEAGFETIPADAQAAKPARAEFWASNAGFLSRPRAVAISGIPQPLIVADFDSANTFSSKLAYQNALLFPGETPAPIQAVIAPQSVWQRVWPIALAIVVTLGIIFAILSLALLRKNTTTAIAPVGPNDDPTQPRLDEASRQNLLTWFKSAFVQRLVVQRQQMIRDENEAAQRTLAIEEKIGQLQTALQDRITAYEHRIARLETELSAATFENRDLIRSQIDLLKEKVAKAKEEVTFRRN